MSIQDILLSVAKTVVGRDAINALLINRIVKAARNRPHPWSTRFDYICWSGLTDRSYNARLLPAKTVTDLPPVDKVAALFVPEAEQRTCAKSTCLFPAFAQYLTDGFIRTRIFNDPTKDERKRTTSNHEIDLSPLYGRIEEQTAVLRAPPSGSGKGRLKSQMLHGEEYPPFLFDAAGQVKAEFRDASGRPVLDEPLGLDHTKPGFDKIFAVGGDRVNAAPQVAMMNTLFLREHNRLAGLIAQAHPGWDDEHVFQTTRNNVIVMFIKIVVEEYINHINTSNFRFLAEGKVAWDASWNRPNWMTAEFSLLYRWHSLVPEELSWGGAPVNGGTTLLNNALLIDAGLATAFAEISANNAACLGLHNSATFLWKAELSAVQQARDNRLASYNDYREAMGLKRKKSFEDVAGTSSDPVAKERRAHLASELRGLYGDVDRIEFYVGLFAEPTEKNGVLPELIQAMVAMDAFSQALTNPLLSQHIWGDDRNKLDAFTQIGLDAIVATKTLRDILVRNSANLGDRFVGMTRADWKRS
ncbi:heme peroxidase [Sphingomonas sp. AP4-R1]|uniref:peroxidase family protein n=1 Tax=Sphingomonas sp. AP4-R1 TaxID=2735134 RepID=UPI001493C1EC|nr:peroxidase family protein [Sphingomonas sp. AP4-R1]QJU57840.1 heme peroxidase [Sphingomonas sp. AP4-R1]